MKLKLTPIAILLCLSILSISIIDRTPAAARTATPLTVRRQQVLVKQINQRALSFYEAFIKQSVRTTATVDYEMNNLLEDLLLAVDSLTDARHMRHNLMVVRQITVDIEKELLWVYISSDVIMAWSRLHEDLDRLAKINGIKWSVAVITNELIALLVSDVDTAVARVGCLRDIKKKYAPFTPRNIPLISVVSKGEIYSLAKQFGWGAVS